MFKASIDVGSNTILLLTGLYSKKWIQQKTYSHITGLGKKIDSTKKFSDESMELSYAAFKDYSLILKKQNVDPSEVVVTATEASRYVDNSETFFNKIKKDFGFSTHLISSEGEAYYTSLGVWSGLRQNDLRFDQACLIDIGGASTEFINIRIKPTFEYLDSISLPFGSVRATDWLSNNKFEENVHDIFLKYNIEKYRTDHIVCVAGSMTAIGGMLKNLLTYSDEAVDGVKFNFKDLVLLNEKIESLKVVQLLSKFPFLGKRADTIRGGIKVGLACGEKLQVKDFEISTYGLRHGTLFSKKLEEKYVIKRFS